MGQAYQGFQISLELERKVVQNHIESMEQETIPVTVPKGIEHEEVIILSEKGNISDAGLRGDVHLVIRIEPHPLFERRSMDLYYKTTISLQHALCGFALEIPHLNGKMLRLTNKNQTNVIHPGFMKELPSYGMIRGDQTGKLILEFDVSFPETLTIEQKNAIEAILET